MLDLEASGKRKYAVVILRVDELADLKCVTKRRLKQENNKAQPLNLRRPSCAKEQNAIVGIN